MVMTAIENGRNEVFFGDKALQGFIIANAYRTHFGIEGEGAVAPESGDILDAVGPVAVAAEGVVRHAIRIGIIDKGAGAVETGDERVFERFEDVFGRVELFLLGDG